MTEQKGEDEDVHSRHVPSATLPNARLPTTDQNESPTIDQMPHWLLSQAKDLLQQCKRIKARNSELHLTACEVAADVFEFQAKLAKQLASYSTIMHTVEGVVGAGISRQIEDGVQSAMNGVILQSLGGSDLYPGRDREEGHDENSTFRVGTGTIITSGISHIGRVSTKRSHEGDIVSNTERSYPTPLPSGLPGHTSDSGFPRKRLRLERDISPPDTRLKPPGSSENGSSDDSSYSPSSGTDSSVMGPSEPFEVACERHRMKECTLPTDEEISGEESSGKSDSGVPWNSYVACEIDESDGNYSPPPWNQEDLMDLDKKHRDVRNYYRRQSVDHYNAMEEAFLCGPLSSSGLTTDDSEEHYYNASTLHCSTELRDKRLMKVLGPYDLGDTLEHALRSACRHSRTIEEEREEDAQIIERWKQRRWNNLLYYLKDPDFVRCDVDGRISEIFRSHHCTYEFDNDFDWRWFEKSGF